MSGPRQQKSSYHQKALQQIRNSLQPFATSETGSSSSGVSSYSSNNDYSKDYYRPPQSSSPSRHSPRGIEYRAQQYPFVPSQVPPSVQQLLRRIDSPSSPSSSSSNSPTSQLAPIVNKKPTLIIKSTVVPKPVLQTAVPYSLPPPLPPKPKPKVMLNNNNNNNNDEFTNTTLPPRMEMPSNNNNNYTKEYINPVLPLTPQSSTPPSPLSFDPYPSQQQILHQLQLPQQQPLSQVQQPILQQTKAYQPDTSSTNNNNNNNNSNNHNNNNNKNTATNGTEPRRTAPGPETGRNPPEVTTHESPIPERKKLSREKEEERFESKVRVYSPQAFKFFMEQHVENVIKSHKERVNRRLQLEAEMAKIGLSEEAQTQMRRMLSQKESNYIRLKRAKMDKSMFKIIRTIGVGAFGEVALVRKLDTQHLYAMKTLRKSDVLRRNQVAHVKAERDILAEADNEWVVKLYYSFQDVDNLYFVMDYIPGGDLMSLLIKKGIFEEPLARFYIAEITCAVESVHKMGFIHRDIKPDNILIDRDGHIKLTDFGLCTGFRWTHNSKYYQDTSGCNCEQNCQWQTCTNGEKPLERRRKKEHIRCLAHSLVGTPNYISPEVLMRTGYTQLCDWWSVGVILYEMLVGQPPFLASTPAETQYKVINWAHTLRIPSQAQLSSQAKDLILKLCTDHTRRLGKDGPQQVKSHPFFNSIDFKSGLRRTAAPYIPKIRHPTDTSNFDPCDGDKPEDTESSPLDNQFHGFFEFTFRRFFDDAYNEDGGPVYV